MVFKRNRNQEVNANENKLTALEAAFIKKIADDGFEYLKDDYEDRNEMHIFWSYSVLRMTMSTMSTRTTVSMTANVSVDALETAMSVNSLIRSHSVTLSLFISQSE